MVRSLHLWVKYSWSNVFNHENHTYLPHESYPLYGTPPLCEWIVVRPSHCGLYTLHSTENDVTIITRYASGGCVCVCVCVCIIVQVFGLEVLLSGFTEKPSNTGGHVCCDSL